jgi:siroheme synthase
MRSSPLASCSAQPAAGLVFLIGSDPDRPGQLPWPARAALAAADAVLHDGDVDPGTLALAPRGCLVELAPEDTARAQKLASEGWHLVWLVAGDPASSPASLDRAERLAAAGITTHTIAGLPSRRTKLAAATCAGAATAPQFLATALNGLAG